jgi:hypothetical protein
MNRKSPHGLRIAIRPVTHLWERWILSRALRSLRPTHPAVPAIVRRLNDPQRCPSPLHPHDSIVVGASVIAMLVFLGMVAVGCVK